MFKGLGQLGDMAGMMKQAGAMKAKVEAMQAELAKIVVIGEAGAGMVKARATARGELTGVEIDPSLFKAEDREVLEDLIVAAVREALASAKDRTQEEMAKIASDLGLPAGFKLPF